MSGVDSYGAGISLVIIDVATITLNIVLLATIARLRRSYPGNDLQSCLAASDLICGIFPMPIAIFAYLTRWDVGNSNAGISTESNVCKFFAWVSFFSKAESALILAILALYHCLAQRTNWLDPRVISKRLMWTCIAGIIPVGVVAAMPMMVSNSLPLVRPFGEAYCHFDYTLSVDDFMAHYTAAIATLGFIVITVVGVCAFFIMAGVRKYSQKERESKYKQSPDEEADKDKLIINFQRQQEKANLVIFACFLVCYMPFLILLVLALCDLEINPKFDFLSVRVMSITAALNPFIAICRHPLYRRELGSKIKKLCGRCGDRLCCKALRKMTGDQNDWENLSVEFPQFVGEINNLSAQKPLDSNHVSEKMSKIELKPAAQDPEKETRPASLCRTCHNDSQPATLLPPTKLHPAINANNLDVVKAEKGVVKYAMLRHLEHKSSPPVNADGSDVTFTNLTSQSGSKATPPSRQNHPPHTCPEKYCDRCLKYQQLARNKYLKKKQIRTQKRRQDDIRNIRCYNDSPQNAGGENDNVHDRPPSSNSVHVRIEYNKRAVPSSNDELSSTTTGNETTETISTYRGTTTASERSAGGKSDMEQNMLISGLKKTQDPRLFNLLFQSVMNDENKKKKDLDHSHGHEYKESSLAFVHNFLSTMMGRSYDSRESNEPEPESDNRQNHDVSAYLQTTTL